MCYFYSRWPAPWRSSYRNKLSLVVTPFKFSWLGRVNQGRDQILTTVSRLASSTCIYHCFEESRCFQNGCSDAHNLILCSSMTRKFAIFSCVLCDNKNYNLMWSIHAGRTTTMCVIIDVTTHFYRRPYCSEYLLSCNSINDRYTTIVYNCKPVSRIRGDKICR